MLSTSLRNNSLTALVNNKVYSCDSTHPNWQKILQAVRDHNESLLVKLIDVKRSVVNFVSGRLRVCGNEVLYDGKRLEGIIVDRLLEFIRNDLPAEPLCRFIAKLMQNPSKRAVEELYKFLEHKNMPITPDGNFLAYKGIQKNWYSITSGKLTMIQGRVDAEGHILNVVGAVVECKRNEVCDDKEIGCSKGIHAGSLEYATDFGSGGRVVIVEIDPTNVVSIPTDCSCQKLRTCKYKVVGEYELPLDNTFTDAFCEDKEWRNSCCQKPKSPCKCDNDEDAYEQGFQDGYDGNDQSFDAQAYLDGYKDGQASWDEDNEECN
jgi:hypothetical protein